MVDLSLSPSLEEYMFTAGILISFFGMMAAAAISRKHIADALKEAGFSRSTALMLAMAVMIFVGIELLVVHPTQQIFFDDDIYLAMAQDLIHTGQAWMCNYGTPTFCYDGGILHEPIGAAFNLAIGFMIFGVNRAVAYGIGVVLGAVAVASTFLAALLLFRDRKAAFMSSIFIALAPVLLLWAMPTNSDLPTLTYSLVAVFFMLVFMRKKHLGTMAAAAFSLALATYMKVDAIAYVAVIPLMYLVMDGKGLADSVKSNAGRIARGLGDTKVLVVLLVFIIAIAPEIIFVQAELHGSYGYSGTIVQNTCNPSQTITAVSAMDLQNFGANVCGNVLFWFNQYGTIISYPAYPIAQPAIFTLFAILGAAAMLAMRERRRVFLSIALWFASFFAIYTAFYGGSVLYGVDWRFQLGLIAQVSMLSGFGASALLGIGRINLSGKGTAERKGERSFRKLLLFSAAGVVLATVSYAFYSELPAVGILPSQISQAQTARFDENFVFNSSYLIPPDSLVLSYDPTLFIINNKTSAQMDTIFDKAQLQTYNATYKHLVIDWGYWCYTPNNYCTQVQQQFKLVPIVTAVDNQSSPPQTFGFYLVNGTK